MVYYLLDSILDHMDILIRGVSSVLLNLTLGSVIRGSVYMIGGVYKDKTSIKQVDNTKHEILALKDLEPRFGKRSTYTSPTDLKPLVFFCTHSSFKYTVSHVCVYVQT